MISVAALWIFVLLLGGGIALDRVLTNAITQNFDDGQQYVLTSMIAAAEIGPDGEVLLNRPLGDQRFLEPYSGFYWQMGGKGFELFRSRSLWDRAQVRNCAVRSASPSWAGCCCRSFSLCSRRR